MVSSEYKIVFYRKTAGIVPVRDFLSELRPSARAKILKFALRLMAQGYLEEPYSRHIEGPIRELRVDFGKDRHRIFYFAFSGRKVVLLHAFYKKTKKTPRNEILTAKKHHQDYLLTEQDEAV